MAMPRLSRPTPISLPELSSVTIRIHHGIAFHPDFRPIMDWDLAYPPTTAFASCDDTLSQWNEFLSRSAIYPERFGEGPSSITIRVPYVERVIVVFPTRRDHGDGIVRIRDILAAVYRNIVDAASSDGDRHTSRVALIRRHFGGRVKWDGLYPSRSERDVWILHLERQ